MRLLSACFTLAAAPAWAGLVFGPGARTQFEGYVASAGDTFIDFGSAPISLPAGTDLTSQYSAYGVTFSSNISVAGAPFGPVHVEVSSAPGRVNTIVGSPCDGGCVDDGQVGYQALFATPQRRAGLMRNWNTFAVTRFYNQGGQLLAEHVNSVGSEFVGYIADGTNPATDWVARIQMDGNVLSGSRQVGYSDDLFFGTAAVGPSYTPSLLPGFNLIGNSLATGLDVIATFGSLDSPVGGVSDKVESVWSWNAATLKWRFHTPLFTLAESAAYAATHGFEVLGTVPAGAGYWVNAYQPVTLAQQSGAGHGYDAAGFAALPGGFNLLAMGASMSVQAFANSLGVAPVPPATVTASFVSLWTWNTPNSKWYFYSPQLEQPGAIFTNPEYCTNQGYYDFGGGTPPAPALELAPGLGFWVDKG
ncbi:MAG: hypothetical protein IT514_12765 [Burkholderiales bacterium]|nr:hypothetical protein [Burkholderiales bacterium]